MRCSPSVADFDALLRSAISHLTNYDLLDEQWLPVSLPIKMGGWEGERCRRWHFRPIWLRLRAVRHPRTPFLRQSQRQKIKYLGHTYPNGSLFQALFYHWTPFQPSSAGILPASLRPDSKWKSQNPTPLRRYSFWRRPTVVGAPRSIMSAQVG